jgi:2-oxo-hept-3-ene-1,7-dioate hydratase
MNESDRQQAVQLLLDAERACRPVVQLSTTWPTMTVADAYAISQAVTQEKIAKGAKLIGRKIGLTSRAMQQSSQIDEPDYGHLLDYMLVPAGGEVKHASYCIPRVELELAFVLGSPLKGPGVGMLDVLRATEYVVPAIEIIDARIQNPRKIFDTIADNGAAAGLLLGGRPVRPNDIDLRWVGGILYRNSQIEETGLAAGVLGHPALGIAWLANKLAPFDEGLQAGEILLCGSFVRPVWANKGDTLHADFGPLGTVAVQFT